MKRSFVLHFGAAVLLGVVVAMTGTPALGQATAQISVQGYLEDGGTPVNTPQNILLTIFDAPAAGTSLFSELHNSALVVDGVYSIQMGSVGDLTAVDFNQDLWLETKVGATTLSQRTALVTAPAAMTLVAPASLSGPAPDSRVLTVTNTATTGAYGHGLTAFSSGFGDSAGLFGVSASDAGTGVVGLATSPTGDTYGVYGQSTQGVGVYGEGHLGISGLSSTSNGSGVRGEKTSIGIGYGVLGISRSHDDMGAGVAGFATEPVGDAVGVLGQSLSGSGRGVHGLALATSGFTIGVWGKSVSVNGWGVLGQANAPTGTTIGVVGDVSSPDGRGVYGKSRSTSGPTYGVYGESISETPNAAGVKGVDLSTQLEGLGVHGLSHSEAGTGVFGEVDGPDATGVVGRATSTTGNATGVRGSTLASNGTGVFGYAEWPTGFNYGVVGQATSPDGYGGYFYGQEGTGVRTQGGSSSFDLILGGSLSDDNGTLYSDPDYASSDLVFGANDDISLHLDDDNDEAGGTFLISNGANAVVFSVNESGTVQVNGTTVHSSDRNRKEDFAEVDMQDVLAGVVSLPMETWRYRDDPVRHIGPMAQDFSAAFGVGQDDVTIASVDADGVALAAIQALHALVEEQRLYLEKQQAQIRQLQEEVSRLVASQ